MSSPEETRIILDEYNGSLSKWHATKHMGQILNRVIFTTHSDEDYNDSLILTFENEAPNEEEEEETAIPDLAQWPPELSLAVLSHLNATELWLASCVWGQLAHDNSLWHGLCKSRWQYASVYREQTECHPYWKMYLTMDEGTLTFNADPFKGLDYFISHKIVQDNPEEIALFIHHTSSLKAQQIRRLLATRRDIMEYVIKLQNYKNQFLANALRKFFQKIEAPEDRGNYLETLLEKFSKRFCHCNPHMGLTTDTVYILCFSLILLSVDLSSPHVKNKMSKREFIRNIRSAVPSPDDDLAGHLYDNIYLKGHIAGRS